MNDFLYHSVPLDRAQIHRRDPDAVAALRQSHIKRVIPIWREQSLTDDGPMACFAVGQPATDLLNRADETVFLGLDLGDAPVFAADLSSLPPGSDGQGPDLGLDGHWSGLRGVATLLPAGHAALLGYARAMMIWHRRNRFCGLCGAPTTVQEGGHVRQCSNPDCAHPTYPRTDPAVIMRVTDGDSVLLHRQHPWPKGQWSVLAGFVEPGETLEEAVAREVHEETGITVDDVRYQASQPWPYPGSIMLAFSATAVGGILRPDPQELEDARWFTRAQILAEFDDSHRTGGNGLFLPMPGSISRQLMEEWLER